MGFFVGVESFAIFECVSGYVCLVHHKGCRISGGLQGVSLEPGVYGF